MSPRCFRGALESQQCRRRPFSPSSLHRQQSHPGPIPVTPCIYPANPLTLRSNLAWPIHLTRTSLDCGRKLVHLEETHADTGRMCKLHIDSDPSRESNPGPWSCEAAVLTTVLPCRPCEEDYFDAVNGNDLELTASEGGGSGDNKQLLRKLDGYLGGFQTEMLTKYL